ncbi:hypothetical protein OKW31_002066 [Paraburkholderia atlantica]
MIDRELETGHAGLMNGGAEAPAAPAYTPCPDPSLIQWHSVISNGI